MRANRRTRIIHPAWSLILGAWLLLCSAGFWSGNLPAATTPQTGQLDGVVWKEGHEEPIAGAMVTLTGEQGAKDCQSDKEGRYLFSYLTPGIYELFVETREWSGSVHISNIRIQGGSVTTIDTVIKITGPCETVFIDAATEWVGPIPYPPDKAPAKRIPRTR